MRKLFLLLTIALLAVTQQSCRKVSGRGPVVTENRNIADFKEIKSDISGEVYISPGATYKEMTIAAAQAIKWTKDNISKYGGNPDEIVVSGHSAGGQLAALVSIDTSYFQALGIANPVKGMILIDPAGLDMYRYMREVDFGPNNSYLQVFGNDSLTWKNASAIFKLHDHMPPILLYTGGRTLPNITLGAQRFVAKTKSYHTELTYKVVKGKKHIPMITQFFNTGNPLYKQIKTFMNKPR